MELKQQQQEAFDRVVEWYNNPRGKQFFYLAGYAGAGKTFIARHTVGHILGPRANQAIYAAYTGKAAHQMRKSGCDGALTTHKVLYTSGTRSQAELKKWRDELEQVTTFLTEAGHTEEAIAKMPNVVQIRELIQAEEAKARTPKFDVNPNNDLKNCPLACLDECSMVGEKMGHDWMEQGCKTLVLGDPAQLPPVGGLGYFTKGEPDFMLTEIHRQAEGNPIIDLATKYRRCLYPADGWYGSSRVVKRASLSGPDMRDMILGADQVLVGKNDTRHAYNTRIRQLKGIEGAYPKVGERVVCLRNNHDAGLLNGALYIVTKEARVVDELFLEMTVVPEDGGDEQDVVSWVNHFTADEKNLPSHWQDKLEAEEFDFAYALTVHKFQGSQAANVVIIDESYIAGRDRFAWLYTAATRGQESITVVAP